MQLRGARMNLRPTAAFHSRGDLTMHLTRRLSLLAVAPLVAALTFGSTPLAAAAPPTVPAAAAQQSASLLARASAVLPSDSRAQIETTLIRAGIDTVPSGAYLRAIDPTQYQCGPTEYWSWVQQSIAGWIADDFQIIQTLGLDLFPTYDAMLFPESTSFGANGEYTRVINKTFSRMTGFWDVGAGTTKVYAMHSRMIVDAPRVSRLLQIGFGLPGADADGLAAQVAEYFAAPRFDYGNHPFFSLNAYAMTAFEVMPGLTVSRKIVMGDGILDAFRDLGYNDVAPAQLLAHEYGHQVQFSLGDVFPTEQTPEGTRRTELMADAMSSYADTHPLGLSLQWKRTRQMLAVSYSIGDCWFDYSSHHGTPNQRMRAANWGYQLQEAARPKDFIEPSRSFVAKFDDALPTLVAPDA